MTDRDERYEVLLRTKAKQELNSLPSDERAQVVVALIKLAARSSPGKSTERVGLTKVAGEDVRRLAVGNVRVLVEVDDLHKRIVVLAVLVHPMVRYKRFEEATIGALSKVLQGYNVEREVEIADDHADAVFKPKRGKNFLPPIIVEVRMTSDNFAPVVQRLSTLQEFIGKGCLGAIVVPSHLRTGRLRVGKNQFVIGYDMDNNSLDAQSLLSHISSLSSALVP